MLPRSLGMRALPVPDPDEYDRYVFGNEYEFEPALMPYDEDLFFQQSWTGSYPKCVVAANTVSHTFCSRADRVGPADRHGRCVICLENFKDGDCIRSLRCFHPFHQSCVDKWLEGSRLCPICKQDITGSPWTLATEAAASSDSGFTSSDFFADEPGHTPPTPRLRRSAAEVSAPAQHRRPLPAESAHSTRPRLVQPVLRFESGRSALSALYASTASVLQRLHHDRVSQVLHGTAYSAPSTDSRARCQERFGRVSGSALGTLAGGWRLGGQPGRFGSLARPQAALAPSPSSASSASSDTDGSSSSYSSSSSSSTD
ncbi:RNF165 [Symbiodinium necroappetens]|uniref:RNF165 protein n=1 Tax=Symbiodinium necroappetens TaxID=1628268 RepID=A0A812TWD3_9DINO|nr:RNF165 [Symbiodinium necroappetens]